ncbi:TPA: hypothetical protein DEP86_00020, partial [Candidatus Uhrbacteria bacterium]|nr:hypothetical protein [Candidatus Uhrbacteria bacterium]
MSVKRSVKLGSRVIVRKTSSGRNSHRVNTKNESEIFTDSGYAGRRNSGNGKGATVRTLQTDCRTEGGRVVNFGGEVTVIGKFARTEKAELISLAENLSADRYKRDSDDRILR